jgi:hypothetical protein
MPADLTYQNPLVEIQSQEHSLFEIHRSKISLHRAKEGYDYPTIRLPYTFSKLAGLSTCIYQTVHDGALAFLVVISSKSSSDKHKNALSSAKSSVLTWRRSPVRIRPSPLDFYGVLVDWSVLQLLIFLTYPFYKFV